MPASTLNIRNSIRIAGSFIAWVIGSGFATGQEMLRFYASFGLYGYGAVAVNLIGFLGMAYLLMRTGFEHKKEPGFNHFQFFCGQRLGLVYTWLIIATLILLMPVLVAGAGATLYEYYRVPQPLGSAVMTGLLLAAYLMGFERLIQVISSIGPVIIVFSLAIGCGAIAADYGQFSQIESYESALAPYQAAPNWFLSAVLHLSLNFFPPSMYFTRLGVSAASKQELRAGAFLGAFVLIILAHNLFGFGIGYFVTGKLGLGQRQRHSVTLEVGMQNDALAISLVSVFFAPAVAIPAAIGAAIHQVTGSILAGIFARKMDAIEARKAAAAEAVPAPAHH